MRFEVAARVHEPALRALAEAVMPGWVRLRYAREPDYFQGLGAEGPFVQAIVCLDEAGRVLGSGTRAVKPVWIDGRPGHVGYLGGLRSVPEARGGTGLARGYRFLRRLHGDGRCRFYLTTIVEGNTGALSILTSGRGALPHYLDAGRFRCHAVAPRALARLAGPARTGAVRTGRDVDPGRISAFLRREGPRRQFFPRLSEDDWGTPYLLGLTPDDFLVACSPGGEVQGCAAIWDQTGYKQLRVAGYSRIIALLRPLARLATGFSLPPPGQDLRLLTLAFILVREDDPAVLTSLLRAAGAHPRACCFHGLTFGFHAADPLQTVLLPGLTYDSRVFLVAWDEDVEDARRALASGLPLHLELASL